LLNDSHEALTAAVFDLGQYPAGLILEVIVAVPATAKRFVAVPATAKRFVAVPATAKRCVAVPATAKQFVATRGDG